MSIWQEFIKTTNKKLIKLIILNEYLFSITTTKNNNKVKII